MSLIIVMCILAAVSATEGSKNYDYTAGNVNIIITAPHGGYDKDIGCLPRIDGCLLSSQCIFDTTRTEPCPAKVCKANPRADTNTKILAEDLVQLITDGLGKRPHLISMKAHRVQIDANRGDLDEACMGCQACLEAYEQYHGKIRQVLDTIKGGGILFDIHGQAHGQNSTEFGYAIDKTMIDDAVKGEGIDGYSTIQALATRRQASLKDLLLGNQSMGALLENEGFDGLPSPSNPRPGQSNYKYYRGGHTVRTYGSETIDAIQVEAPSEVRLAKYNMRGKYTQALAKAIINFYHIHEYNSLL